MNRPTLELADVFRSLNNSFINSLPLLQRCVVEDIIKCRTAALGGHLNQCDQCGFSQIAYNSCRNRHCPRCRALAGAKWMRKRSEELLPVEYFHVVFTLPDQLSPIALRNKRVIYDILFRATSETLLEIAADPKHLGAGIGFFAVLHTWGQTLQLHPHLHCVIPGGGLSADNSRWISCRAGFFLPIKVLSRMFRGKFITFIRDVYDKGQLSFPSNDEEFRNLLNDLSQIEWVVYAKPPFGGPEQVLKYLARYTHRIAISNRRFVEINDSQVTFSYKDYANRNETKLMTLGTSEFARRFLLHVLPRGFVRIRYYGFFANCYRTRKIELCCSLLSAKVSEEVLLNKSEGGADRCDQLATPEICPSCHLGRMVIVEKIGPTKHYEVSRSIEYLAADTS